MATVVSVGNVTVSTNGALAGQLLDSVNAALNVGNLTTVVAASATLPPPPGPGSVLVIPSSISGNLSIPSGYAYVAYDNPVGATITGGDPTTVLLGNNVNYQGGAGTVIGAGSIGGSIVDSLSGAVIVLSDPPGGYTATDTAAGAIFKIDTGTNSVLGTGGGDTFQITGGTNVANGGGNDTIVASGGTSTVTSTTGGDWVFKGANANLWFQGGSTAASTVISGGGDDTIFAGGAGVNYYGGTGGKDLFIGGATASNLFLGPSQQSVVFSGSAGNNYYLQGADTLIAVAGGGTDQIIGGTIAPTVWGGSNENLVLLGTSSVGLINGQGAQVALFGTNSTINAAGSGGNGVYIGLDMQVDTATGASFTGAQTLVGSNAGHDSLVFFDASVFGAQVGHGADLTILNWQASDTFYLVGFSQQDIKTANAALQGGQSTFTLSDGTTFNFIGAKPGSVVSV